MENLSLFKFDDQQFRIFADETGNPLFVAMDVCKILGYANGRDAIQNHCKKDGVVKRYIIDSMNRNQEVSCLTEANFYRLLLKSNMPAAEPFERWVMEIVLPQIRKSGQYQNTAINKIPQTYAEALRLAADQAELIEKQDKIIQDNKPKVKAAEILLLSDDSIDVGSFAKTIGTGQNKLFAKLKDEGYLIKSGNKNNLPYQRFIDQGLFSVQEITRTINNKIKLFRQTKITPKGQIHFTNKYSTR